MNQEAKQFYADRNIPIEKIILVGVSRRGLSPEAIEKAAESLYGEIKDGREYRDIRLAWEIFSRAKKLKMRTDQADRDEMKQLKSRLAWLEIPWYKRIFRRAGHGA